MIYDWHRNIYCKTHLNKELKSFVLLLKLLEEADGFIVVAAELSVDTLHVLSIVLRELHKHTWGLIN